MKTGLILIIVGSLLFIVSTVGPFLMIIPIFFPNSCQQFSAPGTTSLDITSGGEYYLWNDYHTSFEDKKYYLQKKLPKTVKFELKNEKGKIAGVFTSDTSQSSDMWGTARKSVGYYELTPGKYNLTISGIDNTRIFSFGRNRFTEMGPYIAAGIFAALLSTPISMIIILIGIVLMIIAGVQRIKLSRLEAESLKH